MHRRDFLRTAGAAAAALSAPSLLSAALPQKNWRCLIGGNRCGKSTKAAKIVSEYKCVIAVGRDFRSMARTQLRMLQGTRASGPGMIRQGDLCRMCDLTVKRWSDFLAKIESKALWADECPAYGLEKIAHLFDCVVFSSWPGDYIKGSPFYEECERMGTVEYMRMLPEVERWMCRDGFSRDEWKQRIEGVFP